MTLSLAFAIAGLIAISFVAIREHKRALASRRSLLDRCAALLSDSRIEHGGDGFPSLEGRHRGRFVRAELLPDSMTIRRLPQLWLKLTRIEPRAHLPEFSLLVRPSGMEFYSLTGAHDVRLEPPSGIAAEIITKGNCRASQRTLDICAPALRRIFSDPRAKEVAVTERGLRLIWQAAEGVRGAHLIFRQCRFENAVVDPAALSNALDQLDDLSASLNTQLEAHVA